MILAGFFILINFTAGAGSNSKLTVNSEKVERQVLADTILASGNLIFDSKVKVSSEVTGLVTEILVDEGDFVEKDDVLLQLDKTAYAADVSNYQSAVNAQEIEIDYTKEVTKDIKRRLDLKSRLYEQSSVGLESVESLKSEYRIAKIKEEAAVESLNQKRALLLYAKDKLSKTTFKASMSGLISSVDVKIGETVIASAMNFAGTSLLTLADPHTLIAELRVDEADIANVHIGQVAHIYTAANPRQFILGKVSSIGTSARSSKVGHGLYYAVKVALDNPTELHPGMSCRAEIITQETTPSLSVSISAVRKDKDNDQYYVWVLNNGKVEKRLVEVGMATDTHQSILSGLNIEDEVVTGPSRLFNKFKDGTRVLLKESKS